MRRKEEVEEVDVEAEEVQEEERKQPRIKFSNADFTQNADSY